ncbi:MAG: hypothetical protein ACTSQP_05455 [Promethearchaeota archaeon]
MAIKFEKIWEKKFDEIISKFNLVNINGEPILFLLISNRYYLPDINQLIHPHLPLKFLPLEVPMNSIYCVCNEDIDGCGIDEIILSAHGAHKLYVYKWIDKHYTMIWEGPHSKNHIYSCGVCKFIDPSRYDLIACCEDGDLHVYLFNEGLWNYYKTFTIFDFLITPIKNLGIKGDDLESHYFDTGSILSYDVSNSGRQNFYCIFRLNDLYYERIASQKEIEKFEVSVLWEIFWDEKANVLKHRPLIIENFDPNIDIEYSKRGFFGLNFINDINKDYLLLILQKRQGISIYRYFNGECVFLTEYQILNPRSEDYIIQMDVADIDGCGKKEIVIFDSINSIKIYQPIIGENNEISLILKGNFKLKEKHEDFLLLDDFDGDGRKEMLLLKESKDIITVYKIKFNV